MMSEIHLFILWENALAKKESILSDIGERFHIIDIINIKWDEDNFSNNLTRFYGEKLPDGSHKELECGTGRFTLIIVLDENPIYEIRNTTGGEAIVNVRMFDAKTTYRSWTGGGHKIHATNDPKETNHDLLMLLGTTYEECFQSIGEELYAKPKEHDLDQNLNGCIQWESLGQMFKVLNETTEYVVLRNFDGMPEKYYIDGHGDIDLLVRNKDEVAFLLNATPVFSEKFRVHYKVNINHQTVRVDLRYVGDAYYPTEWQEKILNGRVNNNGIYVPSDEDLKYSLLYHALIHKKYISDDYLDKLSVLGGNEKMLSQTLKQFMTFNNYDYCEPNDLSVYYNIGIARDEWSIKRWIYWFVMRVSAFREKLNTKMISMQFGKKIKGKVRYAFQKIF